MSRPALPSDYFALPRTAPHFAAASVLAACLNTFLGVACMSAADHSFDRLLGSVLFIATVAAAGVFLALAAIARGRRLALAAVALSANLATASLFVFALCLRI